MVPNVREGEKKYRGAAEEENEEGDAAHKGCLLNRGGKGEKKGRAYGKPRQQTEDRRSEGRPEAPGLQEKRT